MTIQCPYCDKTLNVKPESAGKKGRCPSCQQIFVTPSADMEQPDPPDTPVSVDMEESTNAEKTETTAMEESTNTEEAETVVSHAESGAAISSRKTGIKLLKWLLIFGALFLLVFAATIAGLMLFAQ